MENDQIEEKIFIYSLCSLFLSASIYAVVVSLFGTDGVTGLFSQGTVETLSLVVNSLTGLALAYFYFRGFEVQKEERSLTDDIVSLTEKQTSIEEWRQKVERIKYKPRLNIRVTDVDEEGIYVKCQNTSQARAVGLDAEIKFFISPDHIGEYNHGVEVTPLSEYTIQDTMSANGHSDLDVEVNYHTKDKIRLEIRTEGYVQPDISSGAEIRPQDEELVLIKYPIARSIDPLATRPEDSSLEDMISSFLDHSDPILVGAKVRFSYKNSLGDEIASEQLCQGWSECQSDEETDYNELFNGDSKVIGKRPAAMGVSEAYIARFWHQ